MNPEAKFIQIFDDSTIDLIVQVVSENLKKEIKQTETGKELIELVLKPLDLSQFYQR